MADATADEADVTAKKSKLPLILGVVLALLGAAGGFFAVSSGMILGGGGSDAAAASANEATAEETATPMEDDTDIEGGAEAPPTAVAPVELGDIAFVELPPLLVSLGPGAQNTHLRFRATLEVPSRHAAEVTTLQPRVLDAMNSYLRALSPADIEAQDALLLIRAQLTRRVQLVLGEEKLRDLLVLEFVLN
ncbi:flagellar FliL protein [Roseivivax marinus]|uniref:flagellar basal body-associated FliL family protein n=1 Tax=Roseivivax marinus TaxID=1379903 RepID=UPI0008CC7585|nr:flagellar basal body-associated FliL family protein [Roseivivax marinus]SEK21951.1 flagellar FliL protein [Roseivivax marinus]